MIDVNVLALLCYHPSYHWSRLRRSCPLEKISTFWGKFVTMLMSLRGGMRLNGYWKLVKVMSVFITVHEHLKNIYFYILFSQWRVCFPRRKDLFSMQWKWRTKQRQRRFFKCWLMSHGCWITWRRLKSIFSWDRETLFSISWNWFSKWTLLV